MVPLIIGFGVNGWNVYRALREGGVSPVALDNSPSSVFWRSRGVRLVYCEHLGGSSLIKALQTLAGSGDTYAVISATEEAVRTLSEGREALPPNVMLPFPERQTLDMLLDKWQFYSRAVAEGCSIYPLHLVKDWHELEPKTPVQFPCILKARRKLYAPGLAKAYRLQNEAELWSVLETISRIPGVAPTDFVIQRWGAGGDGDVIFCLQYYDRRSEPKISFVGRKIRQWHPETGGTCSAEPLADAEALIESTRCFQAVGMWGLCSMEFKRSAEDGKLSMIEPTACRADYQEGVAVANGYNIPLAAYCDLAGLADYLPRPARRPVKWVHAGDDFQSALHYVGQGSLTWQGWARSLRGPKAYAIFSPADPWPFLDLVRQEAIRHIKKVWRRR